MPAPELFGDAFVLCAGLPMDASGGCFAYEEGKLVREEAMEG